VFCWRSRSTDRGGLSPHSPILQVLSAFLWVGALFYLVMLLQSYQYVVQYLVSLSLYQSFTLMDCVETVKS